MNLPKPGRVGAKLLQSYFKILTTISAWFLSKTFANTFEYWNY